VLEFLVSAPNPHIVAAGSVLLLDPNCPLYTSSPSDSSCGRRSSSTAAIAGGTIGGIIAGAVLASAVAAVLLVAIFIYLRKKYSKDDDISPHPTTKMLKGKSQTEANVVGEEYYETMLDPTHKQSFDANYEDPSKICRPKMEVTSSGGYEVPDCGQQISQSKDKVAGNKPLNKPKKSKCEN